MGLGLKRSSLGMMAIFTISIIALIGFSNHDAYAVDYLVDGQSSCQALPVAFNADWVGDFGPYTNICRIQADVTLASGDTLTANGVTLQVDAGTVTNAGTITINDGSTLYSIDSIHNTGTIHILSGGSFDIESSQTYNDAGGIITNEGNININAEAVLNNNVDATITNSNGAAITNNQNIVNSGTITNNNGGAITNNNGGTINNNDPGTINNNPGGTITNNPTGIITNTSGISNSGEFDNFGEFDNYGTVANYEILYNSGTINNNDPSYIINYGTINNDGSTINNSGTIENKSGGKIFNTGLDGGSGFIINNPTGTVNNYGLISNDFVGGTATITNNGSFTNFCGSITNTGGANIDGSNPINTLCLVFDHATYPVGGTAIITVTATAANTNPGTIQIISGNINSTSDIPGISFSATETGSNTGIFVSIPSITLTSGPSMAGSSLHVAPGDSIYATYGGPAGRGIATITGAVTPTITLGIDNVSPKWGIDPVTASGTTTNSSPTDKIIVKWGDGTHSVVDPATASWGSVSHTYAQGTVGPHTVNATLVDSTLLVVKAGPTANTIVNVQKHHTQLILNPIVSPFAGNEFSANGELDDADMGNVGIPNQSIIFSGTGSAGLVPNPTTNGITFTDSPNLSASSCSGCPGTPNVMRLHTGATISIPSHPPYVELFGADMGGATFSIQVTYVGGSTGTFTTPSIPANTIVALGLTSPGNVGISSIQITGVSSGLAGISKVKTFDRILGQVIESTFPAIPAIPAVTTMSFNQGEFFSVGTTSPIPITGLIVQAAFAGDPDYTAITSDMKSFNTYFSTTSGVAGIGGAETSTPDVGRLIPAKTCDAAGMDVDNLCKSWKGTGATNGIPYQFNTYFGTPGTAYYKLPASCTVGKKCVLVEADSMTGFAPNSASLADVTTAFANSGNGVSLFIQPSSTGTLNTLDENSLQLANNMAVWTDADNTFTNDFDSIKASHFGTVAERPVLSTTQSATIVGSPSSTLQTLEISGITIVTRNTGAPGGVTEGTLTVKVKLPMTSATTLTTSPITQPIPQDSRLKFGPVSTAVNSKANYKILTLTVPFDTTSTIPAASPASFGSIDIPLNLAGGTPPVPIVPDSTTVPLTPIVTTNLIDAKAQAYRYLLFVSSIGGPNPPGPSGITSSAPGNKAIVALGASIFPTTPTEQQQAGTIMHELGHMLGLGHGGPTSAADSTINCKPNYPSVMSYSRQLPTYLGTSDWKLDYSHGVLPDLDETQLTDVMGTPQVTSGTVTPMIVWGTPGSTLVHPATGTTTYNKQTSVTSAPPDIDWLGNGVTAGNIVAPISGFGTSGCTETVAGSQFTGKYHDYNDWNNLNFNFQTGSGASALTGASDAALFTFGDDQIVEEPHSDYNGPILQAQTASSSVYPGPFFDGTESYVKLDGSSVFKGGSTVELEFQLFVSGTKVKLVDWPTTSTNFVGNVAPYIFAKVTTNDPSSPLNGMIIAAQGKFKLDSDPSLFKHYETNWKTPTVTKTTKVYISLFVQPPALTTTPPALSSVLLSTPLKDNHGNVVSEIITLKP